MKELELIELVGALQRRVIRKLSGKLERAGLSTSEGVVLWRLHKKGPSRVSEIAALSGLPPSTLTGLLDRLVAGGWVERQSDPDDRRVVVMKGTAKLDEFSKTSMRSVARDLERSFHNMPKDLIVRLVGDLRLVLDSLENEDGSKK
ncbi:MAG: MarR family transcriptional regulator [Treponema sp.]|nr:MarR family transcriptional regulator [Treponema sp.]